MVNPAMHNNVPKWSKTLSKSCRKCCKISKVCLSILGHYALKSSRRSSRSETISGNWKPLKNHENSFYFILTNWSCFWQIRFCSYYAFSWNQMSDIRKYFYEPLKDGFRSISQNFCRATILWWVDQKT